MRSGSVGDSEPPLTVEPWQRLQAGTEWDELFMPAATMAALRALPAELSERFWGDRGGRAGLLAVFRGPSGVGKTLAARAVAAELQLPVFQANLARLAAGGAIQTGRGLAQLFAGAQQAGAVVELDGAEVLGQMAATSRFGPIDTGDLLRRAEAYPGLIVVSCRHTAGPIQRLAEAADVVVDFPLPDAAARVELWRRHLPAGAQVGDGEIALLADGFPVNAGAIVAA